MKVNNIGNPSTKYLMLVHKKFSPEKMSPIIGIPTIMLLCHPPTVSVALKWLSYSLLFVGA